jgi:hypothetical protein
MRIKMKKLLMSVSFLVLLSSASMAKTEIITEEVCNSPSGCRIEMTDGSCIGCVTITRTIVTKDIVKTTFPTPKKVALTVPISYYKYGYPTTPRMNLLTSTIHK